MAPSSFVDPTYAPDESAATSVDPTSANAPSTGSSDANVSSGNEPHDTAASAQPQPTSRCGKAPSPYRDLDKLFIAGTWRNGSSGTNVPDTDPYTGRTLAIHMAATPQDVDDALASAEHVQPAWAASLPAERADLLMRVARLIARRSEEIIGWLQRETGSIRAKAEFEVMAARAITEEAASFPYRMDGCIVPSDVPGKENRVYRQPLGVVSVITPWNFPFHLSMRSVAPALACGNTVVLKPASDTPVTGGILIAKLFEEAGLPEGALSVVIGRGSSIGDRLVESPVPKLISFTGSSAVGKAIGAKAVGGVNLKRIALELGGDSPLVVLDDADVARAVDIAIIGRFFHQGEICMSTNRIIVDKKIVDDFTRQFVTRARTLICGDPLDPKTDIGPIINNSQLGGLLEKVQRAQQQGATVLLGAEPDGLVLPPVVFGDVDPAWDIARQESFGPIASIITAQDEEDALRLANTSAYGLSAAVVGGDVERATAFARKIDAGMTHVNDMTVADERDVPFGGERNSGLGRFNGKWILDEMTRTHWVSVQHAPRTYPF